MIQVSKELFSNLVDTRLEYIENAITDWKPTGDNNHDEIIFIYENDLDEIWKIWHYDQTLLKQEQRNKRLKLSIDIEKIIEKYSSELGVVHANPDDED
jgi:hypothetical protein